MLRVSERAILLFALFMNGGHLLVYAAAWPGEKWVPFVAIVMAALNFLGSTAISALISRNSAPEEQGLSLGAISAVGSLCGIFGPLLFGDLYKYGGGPPLNLPELPFYVGAGLVLISIVAVVVPSALPAAIEDADRKLHASAAGGLSVRWKS